MIREANIGCGNESLPKDSDWHTDADIANHRQGQRKLVFDVGEVQEPRQTLETTPLLAADALGLSTTFYGPVSEAADPRIQNKLRIDPIGERATDKQVAYLASLRSDLPTEVLPRLSKRQAFKLIERAVQDTTKPRVAV